MSVTKSESVDDLYAKLFKIGSKTGQEWYRRSVIACLRHKGQCEYCGFDLLSSRQVADHLWHIDHLLPQSLYGELADLLDHPENMVLSCKACNLSKSGWDPNRDPIVYSRSGSLTVGQRGELLSRAKKYVRECNSLRDDVFRKQIEVLMPFIDVQSEVQVAGST
jgi:5-methylcytosine-specific restriction endonuclease McrA